MTTSHAPADRVVVAFDGSDPSRAALSVAIDVAERRGALVHVVTAVDAVGSALLADGVYAESAHTAVREAAEIVGRRLGRDQVTTEVTVGAPSAVVLRTLVPGDLVVVGSHGHRPVARMLLGSTSTALVTHAQCPVLVVKNAVPVREGGYVLVGTDGSTEAQDAVRFAGVEAAGRGVPLRLVTCVPPAVDASGFVTGPDDGQLRDAHQVLERAVDGLRADHADLVTERHVLQTHPAVALLRHARGAQLVVVGTRGRGGIRSMLLGSVSREVLQRAECPVAVVHLAVARDDLLVAATADSHARG